MATIDDKVVAMSFESSKFESGVNHAISALEKLKAALHFPTAGKGLDDINAAAKRVDLSHIGRSVDDIKNKLGAFSVAALAVFANVAQKAVAAGANFVKAFTLDPVKAGFSEYTTNLNAVQTILANTQASGAKLKDVNAALKELNDYSDKTIYNFSQMAKNIGTFTAAGVDLDTATGSIKGIANLAALSGSNSEQASTAMYQLSQAISAGRVSLQDWNSVVNAGMGGTVFQRALAQTAESMGTLKEGTVKLTGPMKNVSISGESFRQSLQAGPGKASWLTSDVLTKTLNQFTGDLSNAELKAQGFNDAQIKAIQQTAKTAMHAATEVKTLTGVLDVAKETAGSGWAQTWEIIFGNFGEAKTTFTALSNTINGFINASADARNKVLADWKALGGRTVLIEGIKNAFHALTEVVKPIKEAFRDIFPATTGKDLYDLTVRFKEFTETLKPSPETVENLRRTFRGLFALLDIGKQIIGGIFTVFGKLFGAIGEGSGNFLDFTGNIGDFLVKVDQALKKGDGLHKFFANLGDILATPIKLLGQFASALGDLFSGFSSGGFSSQMDGMTKAMTPFQKIMESISTAWQNFLAGFGDIGSALRPAFDAIVNLISGLGIAIGQAATNMNFDAILQVIRTGLFGGIFLLFKNFLGKGSLADQLGGIGGGIVKNIAGTFKALEGSMVALQQNLKAKTLKEIAIAIGILAASVVALSFVDPERLKSALTAMTVAFGQLLGAMAILGNITKTVGFIKMPVIAASLILLAGAIDALTIAVVILSRLSWEELLKGLGGVGALLGILVAAVVPLSANSAGMIRAGIGLTAIAIALNLMAIAVRQFANMNLQELGKGLGAVAISLGILGVAAAKIKPTGMITMGAGLILIATGLRILANAVEKFGGMNLEVIGKGLAAIGASLIIIGAAMRLMPSNMLITGAGLLIVSVALGKIADAIAQMGGMSINEIAKGIGTLAASLIILAVAMSAMSGMIAGAAALAIAAGGISLLAGALVKMGGMSWESVLKGLITLAGALTILGIAGALITPVIPSLIGLGAALVLIGAGLALAGAGVFLIATGLSALVVAAPTGVGVIVAAFVELQAGIIKNVKLLILGLLEIVKALADTAPKFVDALVKILDSLLDVIIRSSPKIAQAFDALINLALTVIRNNQAKIIQAGFDLIIALLQGIKNNLPALVTLVVDIVVKFVNAISSNLNRIVNAGVDLLGSLIKGILQRISDIVTTVLTIVTRFIGAITDNLGKIATAGLSVLTRFLKAIADRIGDVIKTGVDIAVAFIEGVGNAGPRIITAAVNAITKFINAISSNAVRLADEGMKAITNFLNGVANAINANSGEMRAAGFRVGIAIVNGMTGGLLSAAGDLYAKIEGVMSKAMSLLHKIPKIHSPSEVTYDIGQSLILGLVNGLDSNAQDLYDSAEGVSNGVINSFKNTFQITSPSKVMDKLGREVVQGFAQGIRGDSDEIKKSFQDMNNKLLDSMRSAREEIVSEQKKLEEAEKTHRENLAKLRAAQAAKKPNADDIKQIKEDVKESAAAISEIQKVIDQNQDLLARSNAGHIALTKSLRDEKTELLDLAGNYEVIGEKLKKAQGILAEAQKTRDEAVKSFTEQYSTLPEIVTEDAEGHAVDQLATYMGALDNQAKAVTAYQSTLEQLRKLGLDDATYQKLVKEGPVDQQFATQLLAGGKTAVKSLNVLDDQLMKVSQTLATNAAKNLYQAGVDSAAGIVRGLQAKKGDIFDEMAAIGRQMVAALKKELKIKSPSEAFAEIGQQSMDGMAQGFSDTTVMTDAVDAAAKDALTAMQRSMRKMSNIVAEELDPNLVLTPVLDLTTVRSQAEELRTLTSPVPITAVASYGQASLISSQQTAMQADQPVVAPSGTSVVFEQNNYSPEALSDIDIYRQTKNQISQLKSALALT
jgi:tape measure domain-containing protein